MLPTVGVGADGERKTQTTWESADRPKRKRTDTRVRARAGRKTQLYCSTCNVFLCQTAADPASQQCTTRWHTRDVHLYA